MNQFLPLGGLYNVWADKATGELYSTFNVLTVEANPLMKRIHNSKERMPLIIPRSQESPWLEGELKGDSAMFLIKPYQGGMRGYTVSKELHSPKINPDRPESIEKVEYEQFSGLLP